MDATPSTPRRRRGAEGSAPEHGPSHILLVEDDADHRIVFEAMFHNSAYEVEIVTGGAAAIARVQAEPFDLILMDLQMPEMDGFATTSALRAWERTHGHAPTPIVALTASAMPEQLQSAREAGCDGYIAKPIGRRALLQVIGELTGVRSP